MVKKLIIYVWGCKKIWSNDYFNFINVYYFFFFRNLGKIRNKFKYYSEYEFYRDDYKMFLYKD